MLFISLKYEQLKAWCTPFNMVINTFGLDGLVCQYLTNKICFFTLYGHELAHFITRYKCDDFNMSTPLSTTIKDQNGNFMSESNKEHRESGLFFELAVIERKYWIST